MKFKIELSSYDLYDRPRVSYKIREYLEEFIEKHILFPKNIIVNAKTDVMLCIVLKKEKKGTIEVLPSSTIQGVKLYTLFLSYADILGSQNLVRDFVDLLYEAISIFFRENYKRIKKELLEEAKKHIDYEYLVNLPYPAPYDDQRYINDTSEMYKLVYLENLAFK
ncbi:hypothetical protein [Xanthocytophaga agilis]|uniref:Uncharacterized protein n=1 Tax=Xanthocytophaga agilis TaxID=3048010 RepID=A0AAE3RB71_9BACT|nr:hypothetical protein [Xanthocytophaga agilis]MDJ1504769.1 hypothetical protein [Xanthocytophaga agilis]